MEPNKSNEFLHKNIFFKQYHIILYENKIIEHRLNTIGLTLPEIVTTVEIKYLYLTIRTVKM